MALDGSAPAYEAKIVILGDTGVGKTSIATRFSTGSFDKYSESTIGASFMSKYFVVDDRAYKFQIWDTAGQEKYHSLAPMYYRGAAAAVIVYDITRAETFNTVKKWVKELKAVVPDNVVIAVCGNKDDLVTSRQVDAAEGRAYADSINAIFMETSALRDTNIVRLHEEVARRLPVQEVAPHSDYAEMRGGAGRGGGRGKGEVRVTNKPDGGAGGSGPCC